MGGATGQVVVYSGRGRFAIFFLRYSGPISVNEKVFKNQVENWKIAFLAFFVNLVKCPILPNKVPFFYFWHSMGMGEIDTDTIGHDKLDILGTNQLFLSKKSPIGTAVPMSHLKLLLLPNVLVFKQIWLLYPNHDGKFFFNGTAVPLSHLTLLWHFCSQKSQHWEKCPIIVTKVQDISVTPVILSSTSCWDDT